MTTVELKTTQSTSLSFEITGKEKGKNIKKHQIDGLTLAHEKGVRSGFLFNFRHEENITYWLKITDFNKFYNETIKKSINIQDIINYGGIKINSTIKRTKYTYNLDILWEEEKIETET